jgi:hypothetical protein
LNKTSEHFNGIIYIIKFNIKSSKYKNNAWFVHFFNGDTLGANRAKAHFALGDCLRVVDLVVKFLQ